MLNLIKKYMTDENGAITVDWVVLCAGLVALAATISSLMGENAINLGELVSAFMTGWEFD
ncbi:MAG: hypothetical protein AB8B51_04970 [Sedimentitalea sp.]